MELKWRRGRRKIVIVNLIAIVILLILMDIVLFKKLNKSTDTIDKVLYSISIIISNAFLIIYYADRFNIPTELNMGVNVDTQNWLIIIMGCISSLISASIGGLVAFFVANKQIVETNKQNMENNRIQNIPLLEYDIKPYRYFDDKYDHLLTTCKNNLKECYLNIDITNVGQNCAKEVVIDISSECLNQRIVGKKSKRLIARNSVLNLRESFNLEMNKTYDINLKVYYEDVLDNWYLQEVYITYFAESVSNSNVKYKVDKDKLIGKDIDKL